MQTADAPPAPARAEERAPERQGGPSVVPAAGREEPRVTLGRTGRSVFPVMLTGTDFGPGLGARAAHEVLDRYVELGGNALVATGLEEAGVIGAWMRSRRLRDDLVLSARVSAPDDDAPGTIDRAVKRALGVLGADRIDVLFLAPRADRGLEPALAEAEPLLASGLVGALGLRGVPAVRLIEARVLASAGYPRVDVVDAPYSLVERDPFESSGLATIAALQDLAISSSRPLGHGFLTGPHRTRPHRARHGRAAQVARLFTRRGRRILRQLEQVSLETGLPQAAVALAWVRAQRGVAAPMVAAATPPQVDEIVRGATASLSPRHLDDLGR
ncbi:aldo/keto reductase [Microbacterium sp. gxy059]|uniref:aldo/keto reductase n=1 Tax=Microbacterium sp. gxy059 TaxID=2957199 RepID=UPI003D98CEAA